MKVSVEVFDGTTSRAELERLGFRFREVEASVFVLVQRIPHSEFPLEFTCQRSGEAKIVQRPSEDVIAFSGSLPEHGANGRGHFYFTIPRENTSSVIPKAVGLRELLFFRRSQFLAMFDYECAVTLLTTKVVTSDLTISRSDDANSECLDVSVQLVSGERRYEIKPGCHRLIVSLKSAEKNSWGILPERCFDAVPKRTFVQWIGNGFNTEFIRARKSNGASLQLHRCFDRRHPILAQMPLLPEKLPAEGETATT